MRVILPGPCEHFRIGYVLLIQTTEPGSRARVAICDQMTAHDRHRNGLLRPFDTDAWSKRPSLAASGGDQLYRRKHS
jgi:hypothetical protein